MNMRAILTSQLVLLFKEVDTLNNLVEILPKGDKRGIIYLDNIIKLEDRILKLSRNDPKVLRSTLKKLGYHGKELTIKENIILGE